MCIGALIPLQNLLNKTIERIMETNLQEPCLSDNNIITGRNKKGSSITNLYLKTKQVSKWESDGSSGYSECIQKPDEMHSGHGWKFIFDNYCTIENSY